MLTVIWKSYFNVATFVASVDCWGRVPRACEDAALGYPLPPRAWLVDNSNAFAGLCARLAIRLG